MNTQPLPVIFRIISICLLSTPFILPQAVASNTTNVSGTVVETMKASNYTYVHIDTGKTKLWAAGPVTALIPGAKVTVSTQMPMSDFYSKALDRKFDNIYFVPNFITDGQKDIPSDPHSAIVQTSAEPVTGINKAENGHTIDEIISNSQSMNGKSVIVRGKVRKYTANVLNANWIHIADGSTSRDLTIITSDTAKVGDVVLVNGVLALNKDLGYGYIYDAIIENASITTE